MKHSGRLWLVVFLCVGYVCLGPVGGNAFAGAETLVNTVLGPKPVSDLGVILLHEHIIWNRNGPADAGSGKYTVEEVVEVLLPYLQQLKAAGCDTLVEGTPDGAGRDVEVLRMCAEKSGLNIIAATGVWDAGFTPMVPAEIKDKEIDEIAQVWVKEIQQGIGDSGIKPGFIKITVPDMSLMSAAQEKMLRAALRASNQTGLPVICHCTVASRIESIVKIVEEEQTPYDRFVWIHADFSRKIETVIQMARLGIWIEFDSLGRVYDYSWHLEGVKRMVDEGLIDRLLISQDAGTYYVGQSVQKLIPYHPVFTDFVPQCTAAGISEETIEQIFVKNPAQVLAAGYPGD